MIVYIDETYTEDQAKSVGSQINMIGNVHNANLSPGKRHCKTL